MKRFILIFTLLALVPVLAFGLPSNPKRPIPTYPMNTGDEMVSAPVGPIAPQVPTIDETDLIGDTVTIGMSWYDNQHNGTCGRMNTLEASGWKQFAWMKGENSGASIRHIWWNGIDPNGVWVFPGNGVAVEASTKAGFTNMDIGSNGAGFPCFHEVWAQSAGLPWTSTSMDLIPHAGAFLDFQAPAPPGTLTQIIWPRMQISQDQRLHIFATNQIQTGQAAGYPQRAWYVSATYNSGAGTMTYDPAWTFVDWTQTIAGDVACSPVANNNKTLWAWTRCLAYGVSGPSNPDSAYSQVNNDIYYLTDADGLNPNFAQKINLTHFIPPNPAYLPDSNKADMDTLRAYTDLGTFIDANNYAHIVFTTRSYFALQGTTYWNASLIWHWSEQYPDSFKVVGGTEYFAFNNNVSCGVWNLKAQRPCLGQAANGYLYCMYQVYDTDTLHLSLAGYPSGEIYVSVSTDGGLSWSRGTNVTNTITPTSAPLGQCKSELTPTMAKKVDNYCHIEYVYDLDAGNVNQTEGGWTNNPVRWHRVPTSLIPTTPLVAQTVHLHVPQAALHIVLTPITPPPITVPAAGGTFSFNVAGERIVGPQAAFAGWCRIRYPNGTYTGPTVGPVNINPPVGLLVSRNRNQNIPASYPPGVYTYVGYVANTPLVYPAVDSSTFTFTKLATGTGGPYVWDDNCTGEPFPGEVIATTPTTFAIQGAYPNPFNPSTTIGFTLPEAAHVNLTVFDVDGRTVATLVDGNRAAGHHQVTFDGSNLSSGVYFYTLKAGTNLANGKMALVK